MNFEDISTLIKTQGVKLLWGAMTLIIGFIIVNGILKLAARSSSKVKIDPTLKSFLSNIIKIILYVIVILTAVNVMGIPLTSVITLVASAGVAVSLAMQGALSNLVGGVTLLLLKPIAVGDFVSVNGIDGTVRGIGAFYTDMTTPDNRHVFMPNSSMVNTSIVNYSREGTRRMDITFSVSYSASIPRVREILLALANACPTVMDDPAPVAVMAAFSDSSVSVILRLWCKSSDYLTTLYSLQEDGKKALEDAGIQIPFPQMDVHVKHDKEAL